MDLYTSSVCDHSACCWLWHQFGLVWLKMMPGQAYYLLRFSWIALPIAEPPLLAWGAQAFCPRKNPRAKLEPR